jgi:flagellar protein FliO/FliZ
LSTGRPRARGCFASLGIAVRAGLLVSGLLASAALAADDNKIIFPGGASKDTSTVAPGGSLNTVTLLVGVVLAGVGGWLVWRNRRGAPLGRDLQALAINETRSLGNRQYLVVASYEGKRFLLGVCPGSINMLTSLPEIADEEDAGA